MAPISLLVAEIFDLKKTHTQTSKSQQKHFN